MGDLLHLRDEHETVQMLLPWHVNGTLQTGELALVGAHLAVCEECRTDLGAEVALRELYGDTPISREVPRPPALGEPEHRSPLRPPSRRFTMSRSTVLRAMLAPAAAAAAAAVTLFLVTRPGPPQDDYRLLASDAGAQEGNAIVLFSPNTAERDFRAALEEVEARLVDGPTASGAYVIRVDGEERAEALDQLRELPQVMLAEPIDAAPGS